MLERRKGPVSGGIGEKRESVKKKFGLPVD